MVLSLSQKEDNKKPATLCQAFHLPACQLFVGGRQALRAVLK
jgi:hypothetical protein